MIKVVDLKGKFFSIDDEYILSVQASVLVTKDEDGDHQTEYFEYVKVLDEDGFEIEEIGLSFNTATPGKELFATGTLSLESKSQLKEIKKLQFFDTTVEIKSLNSTQADPYLVNKLENKAINSSSKWVPNLAAKIISKSDEVILTVKASICPQPNDSSYEQDEYFEFAKLLDEEGFQLEEIGIEFSNTRTLKITNATAKTEFYDRSLVSKIKYIQLFDHLVCINSSSKSYQVDENHKNESSINKEEKININNSTLVNNSHCEECHTRTPYGVNVCDTCRSKKLKKLHGITEVKPGKAAQHLVSNCENCQREVPIGAKICDTCRSKQLKNIHSGQKSNQQTSSGSSQSFARTQQSEWKKFPSQTSFTPKKEPIKLSFFDYLVIGVFILVVLIALFG